MREIICILLAMVLLLGILSACGNKQTQAQTEATTDPADGVFVEDVFGDDPTTGDQQTPATTPTESQQPSTTQPTQGSTQPTPGATQPTQGQETPTPPTGEPSETDKLAAEYEAYTAMTAAQKQAFRNGFESNDAFFAWYNSAFAAYKAANPPTQIGPDGNINLG